MSKNVFQTAQNSMKVCFNVVSLTLKIFFGIAFAKVNHPQKICLLFFFLNYGALVLGVLLGLNYFTTSLKF